MPADADRNSDGAQVIGGKVAQRRRRLLRAARRAFLRDGYGVSMDAIAAEAGISRRTLFYAYRSKELLFLAMLDDAIDLDVLTLPLDADRDVEDMLLAFARHYVDQALDVDVIALRRLLQSETQRFPELVRLVSERYFERLLSPLAAYFDRLAQAGSLDRNDGRMLAEHFLGAIMGFARMRALMGLPGRDPPDLNAYLSSAVRLFLHGSCTMECKKD